MNHRCMVLITAASLILKVTIGNVSGQVEGDNVLPLIPWLEKQGVDTSNF